jgi:hypothetical protein
MKNKYILAEDLLNIESKLNNIYLKKNPIGGVFSKNLELIFDNKTTFKCKFVLLSVIKLIVFTLYNKSKLDLVKINSNSLIFKKLNIKSHTKSLINPLITEFPDDAIMFAKEKDTFNKTLYFSMLPALGIIDILVVFFYCLKTFRHVKRCFIFRNSENSV